MTATHINPLSRQFANQDFVDVENAIKENPGITNREIRDFLNERISTQRILRITQGLEREGRITIEDAIKRRPGGGKCKLKVHYWRS